MVLAGFDIGGEDRWNRRCCRKQERREGDVRGSNTSFLKSLQRLGFDIFQIMGMPKGERYSITHDNIPKLEEYLSGVITPRKSWLAAARLKVVSPAIRKAGRLHVRLYQTVEENVASHLVVAVHIDPPDINHVRASKHLTGDVDVDYERGTEIFRRVLIYLQGNLW